MNAATEFDLGPLTWVKGEIEAALDRASEALAQYREATDATKLKFCRTHVHQVHGALAIVGLDGVTQVTEALEELLSAVEDGKTVATPVTIDAMEQTLSAIRQYLDDLMAGEPNQPLRLLPVYRTLSAVRGTARLRPSDLFFPDLSIRPPKRAEPAVRLTPEEFRACLKGERMRFQKGLLALLRNPVGSPQAAAGLEQMRTALKTIEATQETPAARSFWWISQGFLDALADRGIASEQDAKQLCARIDLQIRRLLEGSRNVAERLMRDALYFVGQAPVGQTGLASQIASTFQLDGLIPRIEAAPTTPPQEAALRKLREVIVATEELWNKFCAGSAAALAGFAEQAKNCAQITATVGHTDLKRLGQGLAAIASWLAEQPTRHTEAVAMEVATSILLLQNAQENFKRLGTDFARQVDLMVARLHGCISGSPVSSTDDVPLLDEMTRRAQEKLLISQVAREIQNNLAQIEQALDSFFRDPSNGFDAGALAGPLKQISGALMILGHEKALASLQECATQIQRFGEPTYKAQEDDFVAVAQQLSTLGFFIDALQTGASDYEAFVRKLRGEEEPVAADDEGIEEPHEEEQPITVEAEIEQKKEDTQALLAALKEAPEDEKLKSELKQNLQALSADADLLADHALGETAKAALSALESGSGAHAAELDALHALKASAEAPTPSAETLKLAQASHEEIDAELLEIFLEEAHDVLGSMAEELDKLRAQPHDVDTLTNIRRSAHTLKGSGRMVGLKDLGEVAWEVEQTLNMWLRQEIDVTPEIIEMIDLARNVFLVWVQELEQHTEQAPDASDLVALAQRLRTDTAASAPSAPVSAPVAPAAPAVEPSMELAAPLDTSPQLASSIDDAGLTEPMFEPEAPPMADDMSFDMDLEVVAPTERPAAEGLATDGLAAEGLAVEELAAEALDADSLPSEEPSNESAPPPAADFEISFDLAPADEAVDVVKAPSEDFPLTSDVAAGEPPPAAGPDALETAAAAETASEQIDFSLPEESVVTESIVGEPGAPDDTGESIEIDLSLPEPSELDAQEAMSDIDFTLGDMAPAVEETAVADTAVQIVDLPAGNEGDLAPAEAITLEEVAELPDTEGFEIATSANDFSFSFDLGDEGVATEAEGAAAEALNHEVLPEATDLVEAEAPAPASELETPVVIDDATTAVTEEIEDTAAIVVEAADFAADDSYRPPEASPSLSQLGELAPPAELDSLAPAGEAFEALGEPEYPDLSSAEPASFEAKAAPAQEFAAPETPELADSEPVAPQEPASEVAPDAPTEAAIPTLYDIFSEEARGHLDALHQSYRELEVNPKGPTTFAMTRAAHTLGGIAATVGLVPINKLAIGLEHALLRRDNSEQPDSIQGIEIVRQTILALEDMFAGLSNNISPELPAVLVDALEEIFALPTPSADGVDASSAAGAEVPTTPAASEEAPPASPAPPAQEDQISDVQVETVAMVASRLQEAPRLLDELDDQLLPIFLEEAQDLVQGFADQLREWHENPANPEPPRALARLLHTFKGGARMAGAMNLGEMTHTLETSLEDALRSGGLSLPLLEHIESGCDTLTLIVDRLMKGEAPTLPMPAVSPPDAEVQAAPVEPLAEPAASPVAAEPDTDAHLIPAAAVQEAEAADRRALIRVRADLVDRLVNEAGELSIARARIEGEMRGLKSSLLDLTENVIRLRRQLREIEIQAETQIQARVAQTQEGQVEFDPLELDRFTRFQELTRFMAESVNDVATVQQNLLKNLDDANAALIAQARMNRALQQDLMGIRMVPFASASDRLYRIVRQTAKDLGKRAHLDIRGGHVELDRSVLDKMLAPIEHMLRNALSHGIEDRDVRLAAGKSEVGEVVLALSQEGNEVVVSMSDDGRGLDANKIRARAESVGLLAPGDAADEAKLFDFIFQPGFSTASEVTQISGRGVGMDVVKSEVSSLGGRIEIVSTPGKGTTFRLYLPLTLAVTQTLLVRAAGTLYAVPSTMIEQVLEVKEAGLNEIRDRGEAQWMGNRYPFQFLPHMLGDTKALPETRRRYWVLLLRSGAQRVSILVDELAGNQEVVVKNIGAQLARVVGIAGATVLGDGRVVLILNPVALASRQPLVSVQTLPSVSADVEAQAPVVPEETSRAATLPTVMVVDDSLTVRKITGRLLAREGYQVITAKDGVDALEHLVDTIPDVMLSDIEMPRMDGFDLVRNVRADPRLQELPIIMITSRTADKHRNYALEIGANEYLGKPYDEDTLLGLIANFIKAKRTH